jgi:hypothetical protein
MAELNKSHPIYLCPMHTNIRQSFPGVCRKCGMPLVSENTHFALLQHMTSNRLHLIVMLLLILVVMASVMMISL